MTVQNNHYTSGYIQQIAQEQQTKAPRQVQDTRATLQAIEPKDSSRDDEIRQAVVGVVAHSSYKTQFNTIMSSLADQTLDDETKNLIETVQKTKRQNNIMQVYAYFQEMPKKEPK